MIEALLGLELLSETVEALLLARVPMASLVTTFPKMLKLRRFGKVLLLLAEEMRLKIDKVECDAHRVFLASEVDR